MSDSLRRRVAFDLAFALLLLIAFLLASELAIRWLHIPPRRAIFRAERTGGLYEEDGVVMWPDTPEGQPPKPVVQEDQGCDPDGAFVIAVVGDSIFNGVDLDASEVATVLLKRRLTAEHPDARFCVVNLAVPGFSLYQTLARLRVRLDALSPDLVLMELWGGPPMPPILHGDTVYRFEGHELDARGLANPLGVPPGLNAWLLRRSRLYEYLLLAWPDTCRACRFDLTPHLPLLDDAVDRIEAQGGAVITFMPAFLHFPFDAQPASLAVENAGYEAWIARRGLRNVRLWEALAGHDSAALALDAVHLNAAGQAALAEVFHDAVRADVEAWLDARAD